jgi:hypothetical protein
MKGFLILLAFAMALVLVGLLSLAARWSRDLRKLRARLRAKGPTDSTDGKEIRL